MNLEELVVQYGYIALIIGTYLEGETILIIAGYLALDGFLDLRWVILCAWFGSFAGDQTFFFIGHYKGMDFIHQRPGLKRNAAKAFKLLNRNQLAVILGFRFLYGIRNVTPFLVGSSGYSPLRFFLLNGFGALVWSITFACLGYHLGNLAETLLRDVEKYEKSVFGIVFSGTLIYFLWWNLRMEKKNIK